MGAAAFAAVPWREDRLGIVCRVGMDERSARRTLASARETGFRRIQLQFAWDRADEAYSKSLPAWLKAEGLGVDVLGAYVNCCAPQVLLTQTREMDLLRAVDLAGRMDCRRLVAWTGGYGSDLMKADPRNFTCEAQDQVCRFLDRHAKVLQTAGLTLALESYITLVCPDAAALARLLDRLPRCIAAVLDPPSLTPPARFGERDEVLRDMVRRLRGRVDVVHLKDFDLTADGQGYRLPGPLDGKMNYPLFAEQILSLPGEPAIIAEHLGPEKFADARRRLVPVFAAAAKR